MFYDLVSTHTQNCPS